MNFGKIIKSGLDQDGNATEVEINIAESKVSSPIRTTIEKRVQVHNIDEEIVEYRKFSETVLNDPGIVDPCFLIKTSKVGKQRGYYYVVERYTKLEHFDKA